MRRLIISAAVLAAGAAPSFAANVWSGPAIVSAVTADCARTDLAAGKVMMVTYAPASANFSTDISFVVRPRVFHIHVPERNIVEGYTYSNTFAVDGKGGVTTMIGDTLPTKAAKWVQTPLEPIGAAPFVVIDGKLTNFMNVPGCAVRFKAKLIKLPG